MKLSKNNITKHETMKPKTQLASFIAITLLSVGCGRIVPDPKPVAFEPNLVFAHLMAGQSGQSMDQALNEANNALTDLFGTPDEPKLPEIISKDQDLGGLMSMDHLLVASGPATESGRGLYRKHCALCHGVTGNGRGTSAALLNPYPRDYRMGRFKFKSTTRGAKPLKEDLAFLIKHGIQGTTMVKIPELTDENIAALTDYVIYLSIRGEVERSLIQEAEFFEFESGESLYDPNLKQIDGLLEDNEEAADTLSDEQLEKQEIWEEQLGMLEEFVLDVTEKWLDAEDRYFEVPKRDPAIVPDTIEEVLAAFKSEKESPIKESVIRGQKTFLSDAASCAKCHGKEGLGNGQTNDYDDWTKDWTARFRLDPTKEDTLIPYIARGAFPPRKISPRNFQAGVFRGGSKPEQIYRRIAQGIDGTPMPAASIKPEEIWDLVNFVRSMYVPKETETQVAKL